MTNKNETNDHLAIFQEPYLSFIFSHKKTIESRWSINKIAPYNKIKKGDRIFLKLTSKPILGEAYVDKVIFFDNLCPSEVKEIMEKYKEGLQLNDSYYDVKQKSRYATLIWLTDIIKYDEPIAIQKNNQLSWIDNFDIEKVKK